MPQGLPPDWTAIRRRSKGFSPAAFEFVREGLAHTARAIHGEVQVEAGGEASGAGEQRPQHITGQQLCLGLRELAIERYGLLAGTVMRRWGLKSTQDFGVVVYALIDSGELRSSSEDRIEDFHAVYDFDEAFAKASVAIG